MRMAKRPMKDGIRDVATFKNNDVTNICSQIKFLL